MKRIEATIQRDSEILLISDTHDDVGGMMHEKGLIKHIDYAAKKPEVRKLIHLGDWIECIPTDDKRYVYSKKSTPLPMEQADHMVNLFKPIASQFIVGLGGNHDVKYRNVANLAEYICSKDKLNIPYGTRMCRIIFNDPEGRHLFNFIVLHGAWQFTSHAKDYEQQQANMKAMLRMRLGALRFADCVVQACAHAHKLLISPPANPLYLNDTKDGMRQHYLETVCTDSYIPPEQRWAVCTGSYRKNMVDDVDDYAEIYGPVELGCAKVIIKDGKVYNIEPMKL
jgi:predicted phosphodiesterase